MFLKPDEAAAFTNEFSKKFSLSNPASQKIAGPSPASRIDGSIEFSLFKHGRAGTKSAQRAVSAYYTPKPTDYLRELYFALTGILLYNVFLLKVFRTKSLPKPWFLAAKRTFLSVLCVPLIYLDILLVNMTSETLHNVSVELYTSPEMQIVDKPAATTLLAKSPSILKACIKVCKASNPLLLGFLD